MGPAQLYLQPFEKGGLLCNGRSLAADQGVGRGSGSKEAHCGGSQQKHLAGTPNFTFILDSERNKRKWPRSLSASERRWQGRGDRRSKTSVMSAWPFQPPGLCLSSLFLHTSVQTSNPALVLFCPALFLSGRCLHLNSQNRLGGCWCRRGMGPVQLYLQPVENGCGVRPGTKSSVCTDLQG